MPASTCPSEPDLLAFHLGTLDEDDVERVADHLETCTVCEAAIQKLDTSVDPLLAALRNSPSASGSLLDFRIQPPPDHAPDEAIPALPMWPELPGYEILGVLGRGGMGIVYKGRQIGVNRLVALKRLRMASEKETARARIEAEALGRLQHPYIVQIHEVVEHEGRVYLALEFVAGGSLSERLNGKPQPCEAAAELIELVARAVHHAHLNGIVHRDLKPPNVLLASGMQESEMRAANHGVRSTPYGLPKIADFGLAKWLADDSGHTQHGDVLGTASYMAPEQAAGKLDLIGPGTDIYSLGVMLYEMLTGRVPLQGTSTLETLALVQTEEPVSPRRLQPQIPRDLDTIYLKCLEKEPAGRYGTAAELADDLHRFLNHLPIHARPIAFWERGWKWAKRRPAVAALSAALAVVAITGMAAVAWQWQRAEQKAADELSARRSAEEKQRQVERLSVSIMLDQANSLCESGEVAQGLLWMAEALETSVRIVEPDLERVARLNLAGWRAFLIHQRAECLPGKGVTAAALEPAGGKFVTADSDGDVRLWNSRSGEAINGPLAHRDRVNSVAFSGDGSRILTGSGESQSGHGEAQIWDAATGKPMHAPLVFSEPVLVVAFVGQGERFITVCPTEGRLWRTADLTPVGSPMTHGPAVVDAFGGPRPMTAVVSPDGKLIASGGCDKMLRLWDAVTAEPVGEPMLATQTVVVMAFSPDSKTVLAGSSDGGVRMWDVATGERRGESLRMRGHVRAVAFSPDGQIAAAAGAVGEDDREPSGEVQLCQVETGQNLGAALGHPRPVRALAFSPQGRILLTGCDDGQARFFVTATGAPLGKPWPHHAPLSVVGFTADGSTALTAAITQTKGGSIRLWESPPERAFGRSLVQPGELISVTFAQNNTRLVTHALNGAARQWDLDLGQSQEVLPAEPSPPNKPPGETDSHVELGEVSPDTMSTLTVGSDGVARLRDTSTGKALGPPIGRDGVRAVAYSDDESRVAIAAADGKIVVWDTWLPLDGSAEGVRLWVEVATRMQIAPGGSIHALTGEEVAERRRRLDQLDDHP